MNDDNIVRVLLVEETLNDAERLLNVLRKGGYGVRPAHVDSADAFREKLSEHAWDLVITAADNKAFSVYDVMDELANTNHVVPCIGVVKEYEPDILKKAMGYGARDVVVRSADEHLLLVVDRELNALNTVRSGQAMEQRYWESQGRCMALLDTSQDAIAYVHEGMHIRANPTYVRLFGYSKHDEIAGLPLLDLVASGSANKFKRFFRGLSKSNGNRDMDLEIAACRADGGKFKAQMSFSMASFDGEDCHQIIVRDISQHKEYKKILQQLSNRDHLTGLFNHRYFLRAVEHAITAQQKPSIDGNTSLLCIELENFRAIRRSVGVALTDIIVKDLAKAISGAVPKEGLLARFGDQIFTVLLKQHDLTKSEAVAEEIRCSVESCISDAEGQSVSTTCSIGVVNVTRHASSAQDVLSQADAACRAALEAGGNCWSVYRASRSEKAQHVDPKVEYDELSLAMEDGRLHLRFQPIVSLSGDTQEIYEVFPTFENNAGKRIPAAKLLAQAERCGFAARLDEWVLDALLGIIEQRSESSTLIRFFVRFSESSIKDESFGIHLTKALKRVPSSPGCFTFQLSEITVASQLRLARAFISAVRQLGCGTALEHFGAGLNSFHILNHLDVDYVKIDGALIRSLSGDESSQKQVTQIQERAKQLGKETVATDVADANGLALLWQAGMSYAQGRYIQEPTPNLKFDFSSLSGE